MIPEEKLDQIRGRFEFLEARLNAGAAVADLAALGREYAELHTELQPGQYVLQVTVTNAAGQAETSTTPFVVGSATSG